MTLKNLPIGISTLSTIIADNMVYVDKTKYIYDLVRVSGRYFLSRPRRFGKSLFLDTLKSLFEGREVLFRSLYIHDTWDWGRKHPVIKIDFGAGGVKDSASLNLYLQTFLGQLYADLGLACPKTALPASLIFRDLIIQAEEKYSQKPVVLIDEYDKPLLDNIENPAVQAEIRDGLRDFYSIIKEQDANLQFVFVTGVTKFSKVSIFSGINNLEDITLDEQYAAVCGYTEADLDTCFSGHLEGVDRSLLKRWYNGYRFLGEPVYNPFDILLFISKNHSYRSFWFETGTPTFLIKLFKKRRFFLPELEGLEVGEEILASFELDNIEPATLLFQTGYLTIKKTTKRRGRLGYVLGFPNFEVKTAFSDFLISGYTDLTVEKLRYQDALYDSLLSANAAGLETAIRRLFAAIPWRNFTNNDLADFEGYYASVLYAFFSAIDCMVIAEDISDQGQGDLTVGLGDNIYVLEIKLVPKAPKPTRTPIDVDSANSALAQIIYRDYAAKYRGQPGQRVFELGLVFGRQERNLVQFGWREG